MLTLRTNNFAVSLPLGVVWLLADCMEFRGKQDLWTRRRPEILHALQQQAVIQSVESSNRIEGVTVPVDRLKPLALGKTIPRDRSEEQLAGYRKALAWIFSRKASIHVNAKVILHLHALAQGGTTGDSGRFKTKDNEIIELRPGVGRVVRFRPTPAKQAAAAIDELCESYRNLMDSKTAPPLLLISTFIFDFLCIHPFRDGNGRVSRLLTTLLLEQQGFSVAGFVSLERQIEHAKEEYYRALGDCWRDWTQGKNQIIPWWNYFLTILRRGYNEFAGSVEQASARGGKSDLVRHAILSQTGPFTLAEVSAAMPAASLQLIKKVLSRMKSEGIVRLKSHGRGASWEVL